MAIIRPTIAGSDPARRLDAIGNSVVAASLNPLLSRMTPTPRERMGRTSDGSGTAPSARAIILGPRPTPAPALDPATSSATHAPVTAASSNELLASRLAPCSPVQAASPQAHNPLTELRPEPSTAIPPI